METQTSIQNFVSSSTTHPLSLDLNQMLLRFLNGGPSVQDIVIHQHCM